MTISDAGGFTEPNGLFDPEVRDPAGDRVHVEVDALQARRVVEQAAARDDSARA